MRTLGALGTIMLACGLGLAQGPAEKNTVGQRVGRSIDSLIADGAALSETARSWLRSTRAKGEAELDRVIAEAKAAAPEAFVGVKVLGPGRDDPAVRWRVVGPGDALPQSLVLLVHGLHEPGGIWDEAAPSLLADGHRVAAFEYPNDQALADSSRLLGEWLATLRARGVTRVSIVAHSMGGLITRDVLTGKDWYAGTGSERLPEVRRIVIVSTPNKGSALAHAAWLAEARESLVRWANSEGKEWTVLLGAFKDGDGRAADDLLPDSAYLKDLNSRPLPRGVRITTIVGVLGAGAEGGLADLLDSNLGRRLLKPEDIARSKAALIELTKDLGDGIVSERSQVLDGVEDTVRVAGNHRTVLKSFGLEQTLREKAGAERRQAPAVAVILDRLKGE